VAHHASFRTLGALSNAICVRVSAMTPTRQAALEWLCEMVRRRDRDQCLWIDVMQALAAVEQAAPEGEREAERRGLVRDLTTALENRNRELADARAALREADKIIHSQFPDEDDAAIERWGALPAVRAAKGEK
jgi:hypothetical protein